MSEFFETVMLICFGISWPISLIKHIRSKTAKGTSIAFTVFIILGYAAGILAKMISGVRMNFVMAVYLLNLTMVLADFAVYFINLYRDKKKEGNKNVG